MGGYMDGWRSKRPLCDPSKKPLFFIEKMLRLLEIFMVKKSSPFFSKLVRVRGPNHYILLILPQYKAINRLTPPTLCIQTPPRRSSADPKPICHFDPLLGGFLYLAWFFDSCIPLRDMVPNVPSGYWKLERKKSKVYAI